MQCCHKIPPFKLPLSKIPNFVLQKQITRLKPSLCTRSQAKYPFKKPRGVYVDHTAPLSHQHGPVLALTLADDLTVHKHWDQGALWEPPHIGLRGEMSHM